ncbi:MAG: Gfo/Idh/MocA family oxidoreductase [Ilumatobacteraceae bacterium]
MTPTSTPSDTPSIGLYGAGMISGAHAAAATLLQMPIVGVASRSVERAEQQAGRLRTKALSYAELPGGADVVVVSTPPQCHATDAMAMLAAGAAVVLEKPLCTTLVDADALVEAAAGGRLLYAENLAYAPIFTTLLTMVPELGSVDHLEIRTIQSLPTWGEFTSDAWGGGALFDLGVHPLGIALLVGAAAGAGQVVSVSCHLLGGEGHNSDEHAEVTLTFGGGLVATVISSWQATTYLGHDTQVWDVQVSSPSGVLRGDFWPRPSLEHNGDPVAIPTSTADVPFIEEFGYAGQLAAFANDIATGAAPFMNAAFGRVVLDVVCAAYQSAGRDGVSEAVPFTGDRSKTPLELWHA